MSHFWVYKIDSGARNHEKTAIISAGGTAPSHNLVNLGTEKASPNAAGAPRRNEKRREERERGIKVANKTGGSFGPTRHAFTWSNLRPPPSITLFCAFADLIIIIIVD